MGRFMNCQVEAKQIGKPSAGPLGRQCGQPLNRLWFPRLLHPQSTQVMLRAVPTVQDGNHDESII